MKKSLFLLFTFLMTIGKTYADKLVVDNLNVPQGGQASLIIKFQFDVENLYSGYQFSLILPEGLATVKNEAGNPTFMLGDCYDTSYTVSSSYVACVDNFVALSLQSVPLKGKTGVLLEIPVTALESLNVGDTFVGKLSGIQFGNKDGINTTYLDDIYFTITITEPADPWITLDENSTTLPKESNDETPIKVLRTIKANQWNTICFPFAMTKEQVYEIFGEDVMLYEFMEYEVNDDLTEIKVVFDPALLDEDGFLANYPYIIKTSKNISEFMVTSKVEPDEENAIAEYTNGRTGSRKEVYGTFYGTLKSGGKVPANCLFMNGGKLWYSTGNSNLKAFRGYFEFVDILSSLETSESKIKLVFNDETGIKNIKITTGDKYVYDLQGRQVASPVKGMYIKNGRKVVIK